MSFDVVLAATAVLAGAVASVAGFGIGSLLTPVLAWRVGTKVAVAGVALPHLAGTALRLWMLRAHVDRRVLWQFGIASAVCGLIGAVLHGLLASEVLSRVFGGLLVLAGISSLTGLMERVKLRPRAAWIAGALSGIFGGLVGNQGSIRSAALLGLGVRRDAFVATATAIALLVDAGRLPVYLATQWSAIGQLWPAVATGVVGVLVGTAAGAVVLRRIPETVFRRVVGLLVLAVGVYMLVRPAWRTENGLTEDRGVMFEVLEHTADVGLRVQAADLNGLFAEAGRALSSLLVEDMGAVRPTTWIRIEVAADSREDLLLDWLSEVLHHFEQDHLVLAHFDMAIEGNRLRARAGGEALDLRRHRPRYEVKAITYHGLKVQQTPNGWTAEVVTDI